MKKVLFTCLILSVMFCNLQCVRRQEANESHPTFIKGKISPAQAAAVVWIVDAKDTLSASVIDGSFSMQVKPETYRLVVNAKAPYNNVSLGNLEVTHHHALDVGEIILHQ